MSWKITCVMDEKLKFISDHLGERFSTAELCRRYGISRKTAYKWLSRYQAEGVDGLKDRPRANYEPHRTTPNEITTVLLKVKEEFPFWGPKKVHGYLIKNRPDVIWPVISTIGEIFKRHGLVVPRKYRRRVSPHTEPFKECDVANKVWSADFKGQFKIGSKGYCYPLTITDNYSRFLILCKGLARPNGNNVKKWFEKVFIEYGLPESIRTDNGSPFASTSIAGLSKLSVWWIKLGITPERIDAGEPQQNGRHERMHRTLKHQTAKPPAKSFSAQQRAFNNFMKEYNNLRPHEALNGQCPCDLFVTSKREYPHVIHEYEYPDSYSVRRVKRSGEFRFAGEILPLGTPLAGEYIALEPIDNELYQIHFNHVKLGVFDERTGRIIRPE